MGLSLILSIVRTRATCKQTFKIFFLFHTIVFVLNDTFIPQHSFQLHPAILVYTNLSIRVKAQSHEAMQIIYN